MRHDTIHLKDEFRVNSEWKDEERIKLTEVVARLAYEKSGDVCGRGDEKVLGHGSVPFHSNP